MALFGSILRDDFHSDSDIDILIYLDHSVATGLMEMARMEKQLSDLIGRKVDLRTPNEISDYFRERIIADSKVIYESK